jgi:hypothetical protein
LPSLLHEAWVQVWLVLTLRQEPLPSQVPSLPHWLLAVSSAQVSWGSCPVSAGAHVPFGFPVKALEHALQPVQAEAQQKPSMQLPRLQSPFFWQAVPTGSASVWSAGASGAMLPPWPTDPPVPIPPVPVPP